MAGNDMFMTIYLVCGLWLLSAISDDGFGEIERKKRVGSHMFNAIFQFSSSFARRSSTRKLIILIKPIPYFVRVRKEIHWQAVPQTMSKYALLLSSNGVRSIQYKYILSHRGVQNVCTTWKRGLRRMLGLPYDSHSNLLPRLNDSF